MGANLGDNFTLPGPEPDTLWFEEYDGRLTAFYHRYFWTGNIGNRRARAIAILERIKRQDWNCRWCREELSASKRADTQYCSEGCRKRSARLRRSKAME